MWEPTRLLYGEGRSQWGRGIERHQPSGPAGVMATACLHKEIRRNTGSPSGGQGVTPNRTPARDRPGRLGWRTGP